MSSDNKKSYTVQEAMSRQREFSDLFFDPSTLSQKEKEELTKSFVLALHSEASGLVSAVNFKDHRHDITEVDRHKILYKGVDVFRYVLAILNLWDFTPEEFEKSFYDKDLFLHERHRIQSKQWNGKPVVIVDMDDVLVHFRSEFMTWLHVEKGIYTDPNITEYYNATALLEAGLPPEGVFREFIDSSGFRFLKANDGIVSVVNELHAAGYWIQILTARPSDNLKVYYDTFAWLYDSNIEFDAIDFSGEKFRWLADQQYYGEGKVVCAIDDSPKHAAEFAKHGIKVFAPSLSYNQELLNVPGVEMFNSEKELMEKITLLGDKKHNDC